MPGMGTLLYIHFKAINYITTKHHYAQTGKKGGKTEILGDWTRIKTSHTGQMWTYKERQTKRKHIDILGDCIKAQQKT